MLLALVLVCAGCSDYATPEQLIASAKQERDKGNYRNAIIHLKSVLQKSPQNAEARYLLGVTYNDTGDFKSAEIELRRAIELRYDLANVQIGKPLLMMGQFQKVLNEVPEDTNVGNAVQAEILTLRAQALFGLRRMSEGRELLEQALAKQPEFADALIAKAQLAARERKLDETSQLIDRAIASEPKHATAWLMKGHLARFKTDRAGAAAAYEKILEFSPENFPALLNITSLYIVAGNLDDARKRLDQLRKLAPNHPQTTHLIALIEFRKKKYTAARDAVLQTLKVAPNQLESVLLAGVVELALGSHVQSQPHLVRVLQQAPGSIYARKLLIRSLLKTGQLQRAIEVLEPGLRQTQEDGQLMGIAGEVYLQNNEFAKAEQYFEMSAKLDPKSAAARTGLALSRLKSGETDRALADLETAAQLEPDSDKYHADMLLVTVNLQRANFDEALKALQTLEKKQPKNPLTYSLKAAVYLGKKDEAAARKHLEHALSLNPTYVPAANNLAKLDLQDKKPAVARRRFEAILEKDQNNVEALTALANLGPRLGATPKERIGWLERARKAGPGLVQPQVMLVRAYAQSGDARKALEVAQQVQTAHPDNPELLDMLGTMQFNAGAKEQALATYNKLAALQPKSPTAFFSLAMAQAANANYEAAAVTLRKALALKPDFIDAQKQLVGLELRTGRYPEATKIARQMQKQAAKSPLGFILEGDVLMAEKKFPQAAKAYETAYGMEKNGAVLALLHTALTLAGKPEEADGRIAQWLKESPDDSAMRLYIASASHKSGKYKNAIEQYEWLLKKHPDNALFLNNLASAYHQVKDTRALETAERAYKLKPDNPAVADTLGWILVERGDGKRAVELLQKAVAGAPKVGENRYHLAQALVKTGDRAKARQELQKVLADFPSAPFEKDARKLLQELTP
jgi:putative PEP-CTERM system TPR-repeat lipoprotein